MPQVLVLQLLALSLLLSAGYPLNVVDKHFKVRCETTKGPFTIEVIPEWAPIGARHFLELVLDSFYTDIAFFRCVSGFLTQFGISDKRDKVHWHRANIPDDVPQGRPIEKHVVSYAGGGANTRSTQLFIAFEDLDFLGKEPWEIPFGKVVEGFDTLRKLYKGYQDIPPFGTGPDQLEIQSQGNAYIHNMFPKTDFLKSCQLLDEADRREVIGMKYQPIEGDDAPPGATEARNGEKSILRDGEEPAEGASLSMDQNQNIEEYYQRKAEHAALHNLRLRKASQASRSQNSLAARALFVLVSGLLLAMIWMKACAPHLLVKSQ